jgi:hypothetical protein
VVEIIAGDDGGRLDGVDEDSMVHVWNDER